MRRRPLPPPKVHEVVLGPPVAASARPRRWFDPVAGWVRRKERALSHAMAKHFYPLLPGTSVPYGFQVEWGLTVAEAEVGIRELDAPFDGCRILYVSDLHAGPFVRAETLARAFERFMSLSPDLVVLGGDFATSRAEEVDPHLTWIGELRAPLGVFGVLGNHDHYTGAPDRVRDALRSAGVAMLHNGAVALDHRGGRLVLVGVDDWNHGKPDLDRADAEARAIDGHVPRILLSHNPDAFFEAASRGIALTLSGHTHGGQVRIPGLPVLVRMSRYRLDEGRFRHRDSELIVSRGIGVSGIPLRVACPPEGLLVTLRRTAP